MNDILWWGAMTFLYAMCFVNYLAIKNNSEAIGKLFEFSLKDAPDISSLTKEEIKELEDDN